MTSPMIDMAHSELRSLVTKAARGVGMEWGLAEEAGWAAGWLATRGLPAADFASEWFGSDQALAASPVAFGVGLADRLTAANELPRNVAVPDGLMAPMYLLPFLHLIAEKHGAVELVGLHGTAVRVTPDGGFSFGVDWSDRTQGWMLRAVHAEPSRSRVLAAARILETLEKVALRGTVPATASSRLNAGPAALDND